MLFRLVLGKEKLKHLVTTSELYVVLINLLNTGERKKTYLLLLWTVVGGRAGNQAWQEFCYVWLELVCHECLRQSGIWTCLNGELWQGKGKVVELLKYSTKS